MTNSCVAQAQWPRVWYITNPRVAQVQWLRLAWRKLRNISRECWGANAFSLVPDSKKEPQFPLSENAQDTSTQADLQGRANDASSGGDHTTSSSRAPLPRAQVSRPVLPHLCFLWGRSGAGNNGEKIETQELGSRLSLFVPLSMWTRHLGLHILHCTTGPHTRSPQC